ncbi:MAG TPA: amino acid ABC transporter permease [Propionibacteriaceae bacterium]|nr:amino acid ABC transporter permease [Propionibacteriaceae bacterium]
MAADTATRVLFDEPGPRGRATIRIATVVALVLVALLVAGAVRQFAVNGQLAPYRWQFFTYTAIVQRLVVDGIGNTFLATAVAAVVAFPLGLVLALGRIARGRVLRRVCTGWIEFFRSMPMILVVYAFLLALPRFGLVLPVFWMLVVPMILVSSATTAEVFRAGIRAVDRGQWEAAQSLGMGPGLVMTQIVLPQAFRIVLPNLLTGLVSLLKDSTLGYVVSYGELMQQGKELVAYYHYMIQTYLVIALVYVLINWLLTRLASWLQRRMGTRRTAARPIEVDLEPAQ